MKKTLKLTAMLMISSLFISVFSPLIAAQGQITEVNPSGVHGRVIILQADEGEEVVAGDNLSFVNPRAFQDGYVPQEGDKIKFDVIKNGKHMTAVNIKQAAPCICTGCCGSPQPDGTGTTTGVAKLVKGSASTSWGAIKGSMK